MSANATSTIIREQAARAPFRVQADECLIAEHGRLFIVGDLSGRLIAVAVYADDRFLVVRAGEEPKKRIQKPRPSAALHKLGSNQYVRKLAGGQS